MYAENLSASHFKSDIYSSNHSKISYRKNITVIKLQLECKKITLMMYEYYTSKIKEMAYFLGFLANFFQKMKNF